jgi:multiple sugar transport system substrate-binding protein
MSENVLFQNPQQNQPPPTAPPPPPQQPAPPSSSQPPPVSPSGPPPPISKSFLSKGLLIKIGAVIVGLVLLTVLGSVIFSFFGEKKPKEVTLTYWGLWEDKAVMTPIIEGFQRKYPHIKVTYIKRDVREHKDTVFARILNGSGPDIFRYHSTWVPMFKSILLPLPTDVITPQEFKKVYYPVIQSDLMQNGAIYGIPLQIDTLALFVNTQLLENVGEEPPQTWENFKRIACKITVRTPGGKIETAGAALGTMNNITHAPDIISLLMAQNYVNMKDPAKTVANVSDTLKFYTAFPKRVCASPTTQGNERANTWDTTLEPSIKAFAGGKLAMYFGYSWDIFTIKALNTELDFSVHPAPSITTGDRKTIASYWVEGVSNKSKHKEEALLFMQYLSQKETLQQLYAEVAKTRQFGELYPRVDLAESLKDNPLIYPFIEQAPVAVSSYFVSDTYDGSERRPGINAQMNQYLLNAVNTTLQNTSADSAAETLTKGATQILKQYGITTSSSR